MSANASRGKIITLEEARRNRLARGLGPAPFDPEAVKQRIARARLAPSAEEREIAVGLVLRDAEEMLQTLAVMGGEIVAFRQKLKMLVQQSADTATINALLLHLAGGMVRVDAKWFAEWDPPPGSGYMVTEEGTEVVVQSVIVDEAKPEGVPSESASQQTEDV